MHDVTFHLVKSNQQLEKLLPKLEQITNAFGNPNNPQNPWLINNQPPANQNGFSPPGFA